MSSYREEWPSYPTYRGAADHKPPTGIDHDFYRMLAEQHLLSELSDLKSRNARLLSLLKECREAIAGLMVLVDKGGD